LSTPNKKRDFPLQIKKRNKNQIIGSDLLVALCHMLRMNAGVCRMIQQKGGDIQE
jgi:hypothetical protein